MTHVGLNGKILNVVLEISLRNTKFPYPHPLIEIRIATLSFKNFFTLYHNFVLVTK